MIEEPDPGYWEKPAAYFVSVASMYTDKSLCHFSTPTLQEVFIILQAVVPHFVAAERPKTEDTVVRLKTRIWDTTLKKWVRMDGTPLVNSQDGWTETRNPVMVGSFNF